MRHSPTIEIIAISYDPLVRAQIQSLIQTRHFETISHFFRTMLDWAKPNIYEYLEHFTIQRVGCRKATTFHLWTEQVIWLNSVPDKRSRSALIMYLSRLYLKTLQFEALFHPTIQTPIALCQISTNPNQIQFSDGTIKYLVKKERRSI